jgi:hypothetical protein
MAEQATAEACPSAKSTTKEALVDAGLHIMLEKEYHHTVWARDDCAFCGDLYAAPRAVFLEDVQRNILSVGHVRPALEGEPLDRFGSHRPKEEAPRRGDILAIDNVILLVGDAAAIVDHAVQHQPGRPWCASIQAGR